MKYIISVAFLIGCLSIPAQSADEPSPRWVFTESMVLENFYRGNTHTHAERSGDTNQSLLPLLHWYRDAGYNFLVLTDHDVSAIPGEFVASETESYIVIAGEEVSSLGIHPIYGDYRPAHVNSLCSNGITLGGRLYDSTRDAIKDTVDRIIETGAVAQVNHPKWQNGLFWDDIAVAPDARLLEVANMHDAVQNWEGAWGTSEDVWDELLTYGRIIYGVATDDTHRITTTGIDGPGKGWVQVAADQLTPTAICGAMESGRFYASTGVEISRITVDMTSLYLDIMPGQGESGGDYTTTFVGRDGEILKTQTGLSSSFTISDDHIFVRANVIGPTGKAWIQPQFIERDIDNDGVADSVDNCTNVPNGPLIPDTGGNSQLDVDGDGYGNICDADLDNNGAVNFGDLAIFRDAFGTSDPDADLDGDGVVNFLDLANFRSSFGQPPGPSGIAP